MTIILATLAIETREDLHFCFCLPCVC